MVEDPEHKLARAIERKMLNGGTALGCGCIVVVPEDSIPFNERLGFIKVASYRKVCDRHENNVTKARVSGVITVCRDNAESMPGLVDEGGNQVSYTRYATLVKLIVKE